MSSAEDLLNELGITRIEDLDLDVIAWHSGLRIERKPLTGCDARVIGSGNSGILTVNSKQSPERQRFSIAHEIGHWHLHRGHLMMCRTDEIDGPSMTAKGFEREADSFASALLMPAALFAPAALALARRDPWTQVSELARQFGTSLTATAIRMLRVDSWQGWLVCSEHGQRRWFQSSKSLPWSGMPHAEVDDRSSAFAMQFDTALPNPRPSKGPSSIWFDGYEARRHQLIEHSVRSVGQVLTLIRKA